MKYILYCTKNNINGKIYVGIHKTFTPDKFDGYLGCGIYTNNTGNKYKHPFPNAVKKYGAENFIRTTLAVVDSEYEALELEAKIVNEYFVKRRDTYNVALGGRMKMINHPVAKYDLGGNLLITFDTISDAAASIKVIPTTIFKVCKTTELTCNGFYWRLIKNKLHKKIIVSNNAKDIKRGGKSIVQYSLAGYKTKVWESAKEAAFNLHCDRATITAACRGKKKTLKNYQWRYASDNLESLPPIETSGGKSRKVIKLDSEGRFLNSYDSITIASDSVNLSKRSIHKALKSGNMSKGFYWKYV